MNGIQSLMQGAAPQRPQPISQPRPAMPNMANPRMGAAMGLVDDDLERAGIDPRTRAAMKAQEAVDLLASADADMAMGQPKPVPEKIIDQRKQQASEGVVGLLQQLMPGMQQRGQQMQRQRQRPPMGGMPARPAPARPPMGGMPSMGAPNMARMADGGIVGYAQGGSMGGQTIVNKPLPVPNSFVKGSANDPDTYFDEMGRIYKGGNDWTRLTNFDPTGPESPDSDEFLRKIEQLERTRREKSTRTAGEFFGDYANYVAESLMGTGPEMGSESIRALAMYERMLQNQIDSGKISDAEAKRLYLELLRSRPEAPNSPLERQQFNKENPNFLPQLEAMKESRRSVIDAKAALGGGMANGGIVGYAQGGTTTPTLGAVPPSAVGDEQIKQFAAQYTALQAGLAAATTPEDKAQSQRLIQDLIRDMGNQHATVMQYIDSTKGFVAPRTSGMAMGGQIKGYAGPDGSDVELDPELLALTEELLAEKVLPTGYTGPSSEERRAEYVVKQERRQQDRLDQQRERRDLKAANPELSGMDINKILERRDQQRAGRSAVGVNKPINLGGIGSLGQPRPEFRMQGTSNAGPSLIGAGREEDIFDPPVGGGMGDPQTKTATTEEEGILERMRTNQAAVTSTTRTPLELESQLKTALGTQLNVMDGARDKETALAKAALGVSEAEKQAAEDIVKADEAYYGKVLDPAERRRRENEVIMQAYLSGNSLVDQARRSGAAQSQLRRQGYTQEREAAKVRPTATIEQEQTARGIRGEAYEAGRGAEKDARSTLNQAIQTTGNFVNSIANREARAALESSRQSMEILKAEMDLLIEGQRLDQESKNMFARYLGVIQGDIVKLRQSLGDVAGDPTMGDEAISREQQTLREAIRGLETASTAIAVKIGLPTTSQAPPTGGGSTALPAGFVPD